MDEQAENPPHPLFPPLDEDDEDSPPPFVTEIQIQRWEQGKKVTCPRVFRGEELLSLSSLAAEYGGGDYELLAKHNGRITARRKYTIPGLLKPMYDMGVSAEPVKPQAPPVANGLPIPTNGEPSMMSLIMLMMNQQAQAADRQLQLMLAMMQNNAGSSLADKAAQQAAYDRQRDQDRQHSESMMAMMRELSQSRGNGSSDETFFRGVEFMRTFSTQQVQQAIEAAKSNNDEGLEGLLGSVMQAIEGGMQLYKMSKEAGGVVPQVTQTPASEVVQ